MCEGEQCLHTGSSAVFVECPDDITLDTWFTLKIVVNGDSVAIYLNDAKVIDSTRGTLKNAMCMIEIYDTDTLLFRNFQFN